MLWGVELLDDRALGRDPAENEGCIMGGIFGWMGFADRSTGSILGPENCR